jgi:RNA polymerase sigma-70 factor (ECF subfamily)
MPEDLSEAQSLLALRGGADRQRALGDLFTSHRQRLRQFIDLRLDHRLRDVIDPSDVLQEAYMVAAKRLEEYLADPRVPFYLWLRLVTGQKLHEIHEQHLDVQKRDPRRKVSLNAAQPPDASSIALAARLANEAGTPSDAAMRAERKERVRAAIEAMEPADREIVALRFYESLSNAEAAGLLGIQEEAARKRYLRAMKRLKRALRREGEDDARDGRT